MKRLIAKGLMFGNLVEVSSPQLIDRYNRAMKHLCGKTTKLKDFHIDLSGYSPEIGDELGDPLYLNYWMRQSGVAELLPSLNAVYIGLSAGSMIMAPNIGQDTDVVLRDIGLTPEQIQALRDQGIVAGG